MPLQDFPQFVGVLVALASEVDAIFVVGSDHLAVVATPEVVVPLALVVPGDQDLVTSIFFGKNQSRKKAKKLPEMLHFFRPFFRACGLFSTEMDASLFFTSECQKICAENPRKIGVETLIVMNLCQVDLWILSYRYVRIAVKAFIFCG